MLNLFYDSYSILNKVYSEGAFLKQAMISVPIEEEIVSICYSDKYAAVVAENSSGNPYRLDVYETNGERKVSFDFDYDYADVKIDGEKIFLYNEESCRVYNMDGVLKFDGQLDFGISCIRGSKKHMTSMIVAGGEVMKELKLK